MTDRWTELRYIVEGMMPLYPYTGAEVRRGVLKDVLDAMARLAATPLAATPAVGKKPVSPDRLVQIVTERYASKLRELGWTPPATALQSEDT